MKFTGKISRKQLEEIAPIGNSPTYMSMADMKKVSNCTVVCVRRARVWVSWIMAVLVMGTHMSTC
jgi:hypothetical protein